MKRNAGIFKVSKILALYNFIMMNKKQNNWELIRKLNTWYLSIASTCTQIHLHFPFSRLKHAQYTTPFLFVWVAVKRWYTGFYVPKYLSLGFTLIDLSYPYCKCILSKSSLWRYDESLSVYELISWNLIVHFLVS